MRKYSAIVLCAGSGSRAALGYNKVLYVHQDKPVFLYAVESFLKDEMCQQIIVVTKEVEKDAFIDVLALKKDVRIQYVVGGKERSDSVSKAMQCVTEEIVLIHDAARRGVDLEDLQKLCLALDACDAALLGLPIVDTVKRVRGNQVVGTEDRSTLFLAQTPQAFHTSSLKKVINKLEENGGYVTDEITLIEQYQKDAKINMLRGSVKYSKWTYEEDFGR